MVDATVAAAPLRQVAVSRGQAVPRDGAVLASTQIAAMATADAASNARIPRPRETSQTAVDALVPGEPGSRNAPLGPHDLAQGPPQAGLGPPTARLPRPPGRSSAPAGRSTARCGPSRASARPITAAGGVRVRASGATCGTRLSVASARKRAPRTLSGSRLLWTSSERPRTRSGGLSLRPGDAEAGNEPAGALRRRPFRQWARR